MCKDDESRLLDGSICYIVSAPEALDERRWKSVLMTPSVNKSIKAVFCDEAHWIELWGGGVEPFRQSYLKLASLQAFFPSTTPYVAVTATASIDTRFKVCKMLNITGSAVITCSPTWINLRYNVIQGHEDIVYRYMWLLEELRSKKLIL